MGESRANINAGGAGGTSIVVAKDTLGGQLQGLFRTTVNTFAATHTFLGNKENLRNEVNSLRVMTPLAGQRATFKKDCRPDVRAIVQSITFDGKYISRWGEHSLMLTINLILMQG